MAFKLSAVRFYLFFAKLDSGSSLLPKLFPAGNKNRVEAFASTRFFVDYLFRFYPTIDTQSPLLSRYLRHTGILAYYSL